MNDIRIALRSLLRSPGFTFAAVATLTLATGAATTVFSIARAVLFAPLPYHEPERIVRIIGSKEGADPSRFHAVSYPDFHDAVAQSGAFERAAAYDEWSPLLMGAGDAEVLNGAAVDSGFFEVFGVRPARGRFFAAAEDQPGNDSSVVISDALWRRKFGAREDIAGQAIRIDNRVLTVAGVAPRGFKDPYLSDTPAPIEIWTTLAVDPAGDRAPRGGRSFTGVARLRRGMTVAEAAARVTAVARNLEKAHPDTNTDRRMTVTPLHARITGGVQKPIWLFLAAVMLLLLMACVNVANLMLARVSSRGNDLAVRAALGARPWHLFVPLYAETLLLGIGGAALGVFLAFAGTRWVARAAADAIPRVESVAVDAPVAMFALGLGLLAALLVAATPAVRQWRGWHALQLRGRGASEDAGALSAHASLVIVQVALSVVLLTGAALVGRSLWNLLSIDTGIDERGAFVFGTRAPSSAYAEVDDASRFYAELERRLREIPGVTAAGATSILPFEGENGVGFTVDGRPPLPAGEEPAAEQRTVTAGYLEAVGIPIVAGRGVTAADDADAAPVVVVDETFARTFFEQSPVGRRITVFGRSREIVGVARAASVMIMGEPATPTFYVPWPQLPIQRSASVAVRTSGSAETIMPAIRAAVASTTPDAPVMNLRPLSAVIGKSLGAQRLRATLLSLFGVAALLLAALGVAGVLATNVARRRREIGVRMALGATAREIAGFVVGRGMRMVAIGLAAGVLLSLGTNRVLQTMLFGVEATDPLSLIAVAALLAIAGLLAAAIPALRAASTDPGTVMRAE
jgi:putative ABC transport system permease protein